MKLRLSTTSLLQFDSPTFMKRDAPQRRIRMRTTYAVMNCQLVTTKIEGILVCTGTATSMRMAIPAATASAACR